ncbi:ATP-binding protein [Kamptonema cortianum]|nr:ATP-binding protein [Geitlerinema splendidum]MDK3156074.1 ATP-binding protein [Kamptonema cortianum]
MTLRARLTLWNAGILSSALILSGLGLIFLVERIVSDALDDELLGRASRSVSPPERAGGGFMGGQRPPFRPDNEQLPPTDPQAGQRDGMIQGFDIRRPRTFRWDSVSSQWNSADEPWDRDLLARSQQGETVFSEKTLDGQELRIVSVPFGSPGDIRRVVQAASEMDSLTALRSARTMFLAVLVPVSLLMAVGGGLFLMRKSMSPIGDLTELAQKISDDSLDSRIEIKSKDEIGKLAFTFNAMLDRLSAAIGSRDRALSRSAELLEQQRQFTADASHELRTPLTRIKIISSAGHQDAAELQHGMEVIDKAADQMSGLVEQLLYLSRIDSNSDGQVVEDIDLLALCRTGSEMTGLDKRSDLTFDVDSDLVVRTYQDPLYRALTNLLSNAHRHTPEGAGIKVSAFRSGEDVVLEVKDNGEGIARHHLPHVMDRFYRVDSARSVGTGGTGLGLAIARSAAERLGGKLEIESELGNGTTARLVLRDLIGD